MVEDSLGDVQMVMVVILLVLTGLSLVPAVGALVFGVWLRRSSGGLTPGSRRRERARAGMPAPAGPVVAASDMQLAHADGRE